MTTSSCAGRVSVFVEGGGSGSGRGADGENGKGGGGGGKGGGRWLFVSHEPVRVGEIGSGWTGDGDGDGEGSGVGDGDDADGSNSEPEPESDGPKRSRSWMDTFGLVESRSDTQSHTTPTQSSTNTTSKPLPKQPDPSNPPPRLIHLSFEPLILHILCASLAHAKPLLSAAIASGFRESGVQSLKNLDDPDACPMVAVRSAGLRFESVVGVVREGADGGEEVYEAIVGEEYLAVMMRVVEGRFGENEVRRERFRGELRRAVRGGNSEPRVGYEDFERRRERKRSEGLRRQQEARREKLERSSEAPEETAENFSFGA